MAFERNLNPPLKYKEERMIWKMLFLLCCQSNLGGACISSKREDAASANCSY
jgi:hypothetical protein